MDPLPSDPNAYYNTLCLTETWIIFLDKSKNFLSLVESCPNNQQY